MELVVLVDEQNQELGTADKNAIHTDSTPLHRAFSLFVFNAKNELLVTQRAPTKKTFPGVWSNTVCGHLLPGETAVVAAERRLKQELGIAAYGIQEVAPYRYRFADKNGIVENEICPILITYSNAYPRPNPVEISAWRWVPWRIFLLELNNNSAAYSPWCIEEAKLIDQKDVLRQIKRP
jgi:isopentenyl-diphosphate delta-isomerase